MFQKILTAVNLDNQLASEKCLQAASQFAQQSQSSLEVLTVIPDYSMPIVGSYFPQDHFQRGKAVVETALQDLLKRLQLNANAHVRTGSVHSEILRVANNLACDLIILSANRPGLRDYLLGPNAAHVVRHARQSVFIVRL